MACVAVGRGHGGHGFGDAAVGWRRSGGGCGERRSGRRGWYRGSGSVGHGRWGGEDERHARVGSHYRRQERLHEENAAMVSVVAGTAREPLGDVDNIL